MIGVKGNQKGLYQAARDCFGEGASVSSSYSLAEYNKGRLELRITKVSDRIRDMVSDGWIGLSQVVEVERVVYNKGRKSTELSYYISSKQCNALYYSELIRSHWGIENGLHWVKDVDFSEDRSKIRTGNAPQNMSLIRNISINLFRLNGHKQLASAQRLLCNDIRTLKKYCT